MVMDNAQANGIKEATATTTRVKMVQISLTFQADSDTEAIAVKEKVCTAIADHPEINVSFAIQERSIPTR